MRREAVRRNLFIEEADAAGWFKHHDLVREFLMTRRKRTNLDEWMREMRHISDWFEAHGDVPNAIEHALLAQQYPRVIELLDHKLDPHWVWDTNRYRTFTRWVMALPPDVRAQHPLLLARAGRLLLDANVLEEMRRVLQEALRHAQAHPDGNVRVWVVGTVANATRHEGNPKQAIAIYHEALREQAVARQALGQDWVAAARPSLLCHAGMRARAFLLRWRALLAVTCYETNNPRWRKHALAALRLCASHSLQRVLIAREPELGAQFWSVCGGGIGA